MDYRRGAAPQVRPPCLVRPPHAAGDSETAPSSARLARHRRIDRRRNAAAVAAGLAAGSVALGIDPVGGERRVRAVRRGRRQRLRRARGDVGAAVGSAPPPRRRPPATPRASSTPAEPYTNDDAVDVTVNVRRTVGELRTPPPVRRRGRRRANPAVEQPIGQTSVQLIPSVALEKGATRSRRRSSARRESERSAIATWVLDTSKPKLTIISPEDGSSTNRTTSRSRARRRPAARSGSRTTTTARPRRSTPTRTACSRARSASRPGSTPSRSRPSTRQATPTTRPSRSARGPARRRRS
jgi:hypothetical protein